jgi:integrase/recombinase XerC
VVELAQDWLAAKTLGSSSAEGHSDAARRSDLARIGRAVCAALGRAAGDARNYDLERDLGPVRLEDLSTETVLRTVAVLKASYAPATARRTLSTLRGFSRWLVRRGHLASDPCDDDALVLPRRSADEVAHAFLTDEVAAMRAAAADPPPNARSAWAARDVAIVDLLAGCGLRAAECCGARVGDVDRRLDRPVLHVRHGVKGGRRRDVPLPRSVLESADRWAAERAERFGRPPRPSERLFVRTNGAVLDDAWLDRLVRRLAHQSGVALRDQVAAHGFRHHYGTQLALRRVPPAIIQELMGHADPRTTAIYTRSVASHLVDALDDAGWL